MNITLTEPAWSRDEGVSDIYLDWGASTPLPGFPADNFSARFTRTLDFEDGTYRFTVRTDDGVRLFVDNMQVPLISHWEAQGATVRSGDLMLAAGPHTVKMEYFELSGEATARLSWPLVSETVCGKIGAAASCSANPDCQWFDCAQFCLPRYTAVQPTCVCVANKTLDSCNIYQTSLGCGWFAYVFRISLAAVWILILFGISSCADLNDPDDTPNTSIHEDELASGWWSPVIANPPYQVICGSPAHVNGALYAADIAAPAGDPVYAAHGGVTVISGWDTSGYGNLVKLRPSDGTGYAHYYGHLQDIHWSIKGRLGVHVSKGQLIGWVGATGNVTGAHLHFHVQTELGVGVNLIGMTGFTDNPNDPYYPSNDGVSHYSCAWMGR